MKMWETRRTPRACEAHEGRRKQADKAQVVKVAVNEAHYRDGYGGLRLDLPLHLMFFILDKAYV